MSIRVNEPAPGMDDRVRRATVGIAGLGGLGSTIAIALTRVGVGHLVLADFDVVEPSNLNRQQYTVAQIGQLKTDALAATLHQINPALVVTPFAGRVTAANAATVFAAVDVLVEAFDAPEAKADLLAAFRPARPQTPIVMASGLAGHGPGNDIGVRRLQPCLYVVGDLHSAAAPGAGLMAPRVGIAAHLQANTVLRLLLGERDG